MFWFSDSFDLYAQPADAILGYWDSGTTSFSLTAGRFTGSRGMSVQGTSGAYLVKTSGQNDAVHHFVCAFQQTAALVGTNAGLYFQLSDGATNQCCVVFRGDGAILLTSATPLGTTLATYTGAVTAINTWYAFEFEVVIHPTAGSFAVRKNGNTSNDFSATALNTRPGTNSYANKLTVGLQSGSAPAAVMDDLLWRSDASSVPWVGDVRCYTRMPVSDAAVQWTPSGSVVPQQTFATTSGTGAIGINTARYQPFVAVCTGTVGSVTLPIAAASTANFKCAIFASAGGVPTTVLGTATPISAPGVGTATWTFGTPVPVTQGTTYFVCFIADASGGTYSQNSAANTGFQSTSTVYASWPVNNPTGLTAVATPAYTVNITPTLATNAPFVAEPQQDGANTYVSSSTVGQADLYGITSISGTPASIVGVVTRAYAQKSDAGTRNIAVNLKSGATTSSGTSTALNTVWSWIYKTDLVDPNTGVAWTATGVNNCSIGVSVTA